MIFKVYIYKFHEEVLLKTVLLFPILFYFISLSLLAQQHDHQNTKNKILTIDNCVNEFSWKDTIQTQVGYQYLLFNKDFIDDKTIKMSVVTPHSAAHRPHEHSEDEFFFVPEGTAEFYLNGKTKLAGKYSAFYRSSNTEHGIRNIENTELKYLVIKKYENKYQ